MYGDKKTPPDESVNSQGELGEQLVNPFWVTPNTF